MLQNAHFAILSTFIKLPFVIKIFVLSIFEWPFYTLSQILLYNVIEHEASLFIILFRDQITKCCQTAGLCTCRLVYTFVVKMQQISFSHNENDK